MVNLSKGRIANLPLPFSLFSLKLGLGNLLFMKIKLFIMDMDLPIHGYLVKIDKRFFHKKGFFIKVYGFFVNFY